MESLWIKLADGIPAVAVTLIMFLIAYMVVYPIVKLMVEKFIPLADRVIVVLEVHGKSSQQLAETLQRSLSDQRELFELHMKEKLEEFSMFEDRIKALEQLLEEKDRRIRALETELSELKKTNGERIIELQQELAAVRAERDDLQKRLKVLEEQNKHDKTRKEKIANAK